jgi:hypothetical protein
VVQGLERTSSGAFYQCWPRFFLNQSLAAESNPRQAAASPVTSITSKVPGRVHGSLPGRRVHPRCGTVAGVPGGPERTQASRAGPRNQSARVGRSSAGRERGGRTVRRRIQGQGRSSAATGPTGQVTRIPLRACRVRRPDRHSLREQQGQSAYSFRAAGMRVPAGANGTRATSTDASKAA